MRTCRTAAGEFCGSPWPWRSRQQRTLTLKIFVRTQTGFKKKQTNLEMERLSQRVCCFGDFTAARPSCHAVIRVDGDCNETEKHVRLSVTTHRDWKRWRAAGAGLRQRGFHQRDEFLHNEASHSLIGSPLAHICVSTYARSRAHTHPPGWRRAGWRLAPLGTAQLVVTMVTWVSYINICITDPA